jgi:hypothetical protein
MQWMYQLLCVVQLLGLSKQKNKKGKTWKQ